MIRAHKTLLKLNNKQATFMAKSAGCARKSYNVVLDMWRNDYKAGLKPNIMSIKKKFNAIKGAEYPYLQEVSKWGNEAAILNLGRAYKNKFEGRSEFPRHHTKKKHNSFTIDGSVVKVEGNKIRLPKIGWLRMAERYRFADRLIKLNSVTISKKAGRWYVSINAEIKNNEANDNQVGSVGIDLGIKKAMTLSDGTVFENPQIEKRFRNRLRRDHRSLSKKRYKSKNWYKAQLRLQKTYHKIANVRNDFQNKATSAIANKYELIALED
jgi:putative transposase